MKQIKLKSSTLSRIILIFLFIATLISYVIANQMGYISIEMILNIANSFKQKITQHFILSMIIYCLIYIAIVTFSIPLASFASISAGYFFGVYIGTLLAVFSATIGACLFVMGTRYIMTDWLSHQKGPWIDKFSDGFQKNTVTYILSLRLIPAVPFVLINIMAAILNVSVIKFGFATFIGIMPAGFIFVSLGAGLDSLLLARSLSLNVGSHLWIGLTGLGVLILLPNLLNYIKHRNKSKSNH